jgi:hemerythrin superfamily protein
MELVELLMVEHAALRLQMRGLVERPDVRQFLSLSSFLLEHHAKLEDLAFFPKMAAVLDGKEFRPLKGLSSDHRLILTLVENMKKWTQEGRQDFFEKRMKTFVDVVLKHNLDEERLAFPLWSRVGEDERRDATLQARRMIEAFPEDAYFSITGLTREFIAMALPG